MNVGKIIKFYREEALLTQSQLGSGICSDTHISKIERGMTEFSDETTVLLAKRLNINLEKEQIRFRNIKSLLNRWHDTIIRQQYTEIENIKVAIEREFQIVFSEYSILYNLLLARYHLVNFETEKAFKILKNTQKNEEKLIPYEKNLLYHILGIYYLDLQQHENALKALVTINQDEYDNHEYYFHLSIAYHATGSLPKAYYNAKKSLDYFTKTKNFLRIIDTEMILLMTGVVEENRVFKEVVSQYETLIINCDLFNAKEKKARLLHNLASEYYARKEYDESFKLLTQSMQLKEKYSKVYLLSLELFSRVADEGKILPKEEILLHINEGITIATNLKQQLYIILFTLLQYSLENESPKYFAYLHETALPFVKEKGLQAFQKKFEVELFNLYKRNQQWERAIHIAEKLINEV